MAGPGRSDSPAISVIVCAYRSRQRIDLALDSLERQDLEEPWETIVVDSGCDGTADHVERRFPGARVLRFERRLYPAAARNAGVRAAEAPFVAFLPDDGVAEPGWLRRRLARHRQGYAAVGGAITNGTPRHPVGTAGYFVEYTALLPSPRTLHEQEIPHCLSYERSLVESLGWFPEECRTGEDTILNLRLVREGRPVAVDPAIRLAHMNPTGLRAYLRHQYDHGLGFAAARGRYPAAATPGPPALPALEVLLRYPAERWWAALRRVARGQPRSLPAYLALGPLVWAGLFAAAIGRWVGLRRASFRGARPRAAPRG